MNIAINPTVFDRTGVNMGFQVEDQGFSVARNMVSKDLIARIDAELTPHFDATPFCAGDFYGERTKRFGRLLARSRAIASLALQPAILELAERVLGPWSDTIQLNVTQAIELHPGALAQFPHRDQDMWGGPKGTHEFLLNVIWPLTPFTDDNGGTLLWPDSHGKAALEENIAGNGICATADPGDAVIFLGSTLHGAGANLSTGLRRGLVIGYSLGWLKPYENLWLAYPPDVARHFSPELAALAGYRQHRPNLGNFEGQCPSILLSDTVGEHLQAIDAMRPDQTALLAAHAQAQRGKREVEPRT